MVASDRAYEGTFYTLQPQSTTGSPLGVQMGGVPDQLPLRHRTHVMLHKHPRKQQYDQSTAAYRPFRKDVNQLSELLCWLYAIYVVSVVVLHHH